jgi:hypothetical protein
MLLLFCEAVYRHRQQKQNKNKLRGLQSESELYRLTAAAGRRILVKTFAESGVSRGQRDGSEQPLIS